MRKHELIIPVVAPFRSPTLVKSLQTVHIFPERLTHLYNTLEVFLFHVQNLSHGLLRILLCIVPSQRDRSLQGVPNLTAIPLEFFDIFIVPLVTP